MKATPGLFIIASNFGNIWSARGQYRVQYTDLKMNKNMYNHTQALRTHLSTHHVQQKYR